METIHFAETKENNTFKKNNNLKRLQQTLIATSFLHFLLLTVVSVVQPTGCSAHLPRELLDVLEGSQQGGRAVFQRAFSEPEMTEE